MREIPLTKGKVALVDDSDFLKISEHKWQAMQKRDIWYAFRSHQRGGMRVTILMHRVILDGVLRVDHRNGDGLDNQRSNLRSATRSQNQANSKKSTRNTTSRFKGVFKPTGYPIWRAKIKLRGKVRYLGSFREEIDAATAYDRAARQMFGEFARTNFSLIAI